MTSPDFSTKIITFKFLMYVFLQFIYSPLNLKNFSKIIKYEKKMKKKT